MEVTSTPLMMSAECGEIFAAIAKAQTAMEPAPKLGTNPAFKSKYAKLDAVMDVAVAAYAAQGIAIIQGARCDGNRVEVETRLGHTSGQWIASTIGASAKDGSPQAVGSAITYLRRYGLSTLAGVVADEDDDGNAAQQGRQPTVADLKAEVQPLLDSIPGVGSIAKLRQVKQEAADLKPHLERLKMDVELMALRAAFQAAEQRLAQGGGNA